MKLKEQYKGLVIGRRINGKMIEFNTNKGNHEWFYNNGFSDLFENIEFKKIKYTNEVDTPILKDSSPEPIKKKKYDTPDDRRDN